MVRRLLASVFLAAFPVVVIPIAVTSIGARAGAAPPAAVQQCKDGGWRTLTDASGQPFKNQGQCISYFIHNPVSLADLGGPFSGTTSFRLGTASCPLAEQSFDATYPGSSAVGSVTLHLVGCVNPATEARAVTVHLHRDLYYRDDRWHSCWRCEWTGLRRAFPTSVRLRADAYCSVRNWRLRRDDRHDPCEHSVVRLWSAWGLIR